MRAVAPTPRSVRLLACGDTGVVRTSEGMVLGKGAAHVAGNFKALRNRADALFLNLECTFSRRGVPVDRTPVFRANPKSFDLIRELRPTVVNLANNHVSDFGVEAFEDTCALLREERIAFFGAGATLQEALKPAIVDVRGILIGFAGFREREAGQFDHNGIITPEAEFELVATTIRSLRPQVDCIVLSLHCGFEYSFYPSPRDVSMRRALVEVGADVIIGHHPHYPQGVEWYRSGVIAHSLGNFVWDQKFVGHTDASFVLLLECGKRGVLAVQTVPVRLQRDYSLWVGHDPALEALVDELSRTLTDSAALRSEWYGACRDRTLEALSLLGRDLRHGSAGDALRKFRRRLRKPRLREAVGDLALEVVSGRAFACEIRRVLAKWQRYYGVGGDE